MKNIMEEMEFERNKRTQLRHITNYKTIDFNK